MDYFLLLRYIVIKLAAQVNCMGAVDVVTELNGDDVHRLGNVMTIEVGLHILFDCLGLWFKITVRYYLTAIC